MRCDRCGEEASTVFVGWDPGTHPEHLCVQCSTQGTWEEPHRPVATVKCRHCGRDFRYPAASLIIKCPFCDRRNDLCYQECACAQCRAKRAQSAYDFWSQKFHEQTSSAPKECTGKDDCQCKKCLERKVADDLRRAQEKFKREFFNSFGSSWSERNRRQAPPPRRPSSEPARVDIPADILRQLIQLCHPDKHGGSKMAHEVTVWLLKQRAFRKASGL